MTETTLTPQVYRDYVPAVLMPAWLTDLFGRRYAAAAGFVTDVMVHAAIQAVRAGMLRTTPVDALHFAGAERRIDRNPNESTTSYRQRLIGAWAWRGKRGSNKAVVDALDEAGLTARIKHNWDWNPDGTQSDPDSWARMWVVIDPPHGATAPEAWGSFVWGDFTWSIGGLSAPFLDFIKRTIRKNRASHAQVVKVIFRLSGVLWGEFTWGSFTWGGESVPLDVE